MSHIMKPSQLTQDLGTYSSRQLDCTCNRGPKRIDNWFQSFKHFKLFKAIGAFKGPSSRRSSGSSG